MLEISDDDPEPYISSTQMAPTVKPTTGIVTESTTDEEPAAESTTGSGDWLFDFSD